MPSASHQTRFYELAGEAAPARLGDLAARLRRAGVQARLLSSQDQEGLYLLVAEAERLPDLEPPDGCRVWTFASVSA